MEVKKYVYPLLRWWWLLVATTLIGGIFSYLATLRQPTVYQARTTVMIGAAINDPNPSNTEFTLSQQLAAAYADIAKRELVRNATMDSLGLRSLPEYYVQALPNTQIIEIIVTHTMPERAQAVANELANQLILLSPTSAGPEELNRQEFVNEQLNLLEVQIEETQGEIEKLQAELGNLVSAQQINSTQNQISALQSKLGTLQGNYANLLSNTQQGAINSLTIIEPATLPTRPIDSQKALTVLLAAAVGFVLGAGAAYLLEYLDDTLKSPEDISRIFQIPIIGHIVEDAGETDENLIYMLEKPRHPISEAFRTLRINMEFAGVDQPLKTIFIASANIGDGKTSVAANLAVSLAQGDKKVVLLDADLRRPSIHQLFSVPNEIGLIDLFLGRAAIGDVIKVKKDHRVAIITAGEPPPNPAELLGSKKMDQILTKLQEIADVVIIDGPPFVVADASVLASKVDGVLAVVRPGHTRQSAAQTMMEQITISGARLIGVTLNRIPRRGTNYYTGEHYTYPYSWESQPVNGNKPADLKKVRLVAAYRNKFANKFRVALKNVFKPSPK
jgi:capsular exopolysaccharide synthesis family protein